MIALISWGVVSHWCPWLFYGSRQAYGVHLYGSEAAYWEHECLVFRESPDRVVYEGNEAKAISLLFPPANYIPQGIYHHEVAAYRPEPWHRWMPRRFIEVGVAFLHGRNTSAGKTRLVAVLTNTKTVVEQRSGIMPYVSLRSLVYSGVRPRLTDSSLDILCQDGGVRLFAGQPDPTDDSHFTIKYEIDDKPGTIDGWLQADDTVKLQIRDGPAATQPSS